MLQSLGSQRVGHDLATEQPTKPLPGPMSVITPALRRAQKGGARSGPQSWCRNGDTSLRGMKQSGKDGSRKP